MNKPKFRENEIVYFGKEKNKGEVTKVLRTRIDKLYFMYRYVVKCVLTQDIEKWWEEDLVIHNHTN